MQISSSIAIYFIIWWLTFFAVLPFGIRSQVEVGEVVAGSEPGAPAATQMLRKVLLTTGIAALLFGLFWMVYVRNFFDLEMIRDISR